MARYVTKVRTPRSVEDAFAYMADLRNFAEWDPGVTAAGSASPIRCSGSRSVGSGTGLPPGCARPSTGSRSPEATSVPVVA